MGTSQGKQYPGQDLDDTSNHTENGQITSHQCVQEGNGSLHIETSTCDQSNFETIDVTASSRSVHKSKRNSITGVEKGTETKTKAMTNGDIDFKPSIHHNQESFDLDNDVNKNENARTTEDTHDEDKNHTRGESTELQGAILIMIEIELLLFFLPTFAYTILNVSQFRYKLLRQTKRDLA